MVVICKNWQALPMSANTVTAPIIEDRPLPPPVSSYTPPPDPIQQQTADIVELNEINHDEPNEPAASPYQYSNSPPPVQPKKRLRIIEQQGLLDQFSFSSSSLMVGGAVIARPGLHHVSRQRHSENKNRPRLVKWFLLRPPWPTP